jgi:hypothetical protein
MVMLALYRTSTLPAAAFVPLISELAAIMSLHTWRLFTLSQTSDTIVSVMGFADFVTAAYAVIMSSPMIAEHATIRSRVNAAVFLSIFFHLLFKPHLTQSVINGFFRIDPYFCPSQLQIKQQLYPKVSLAAPFLWGVYWVTRLFCLDV